VHSPRRVSQSPIAVAIGISLGFHLLLLALALLVRTPATMPAMKRGEPLFVELPQADQPAERGAPASPSSAPKAPPTPSAPPAVKAQPQPRAAPSPPQPSPREVRAPQPRTPEQTAAATAPSRAATPEAPTPDGIQAPAPAPKPAEPVVSEPERLPETSPREASPPQPRVAAVPPQPPMIDTRSALRRGGPGGAGGSGEGWAGIEGEPIPLDSSDPRYNDYLDRIRRMIKEKWGYPCIKDLASGHCDYKSARLVIVFGILKDGRVPVVEVAQQSGYAIYDDYAANAIKLAQPFPPVPASLMASAKSGSSGVKIVAAFQYMLVESSLTNILR
jgi:outer membrane biosynthesis protein TonB